ncbi:MAG TPA: hypothetical protein VM141_04245 [Planctomycetota bacterium]|nr:hypothetical protein [Planctomycetota bacterium]
MKIEELVHRVAGEALNLLEKRYHYRISEEHKKDIQNTVRDNLNSILNEGKEQKESAKAE